MVKKMLFIAMLLVSNLILAQTGADNEWSKNFVVLQNCNEGDFLIRVGDVDNLGFGWEEGFNPFKGGITGSHGFPWEANPKDLPGMDRILMPSSYKNISSPCGGDGYSGSYDPILTKPKTIVLPLLAIKNANIKAAKFQVFIDDFQAPTFCSHFSARINGIEFKELSTVLNHVDQTGPVGKLVSVMIPANLLPELKKDTLKLYIDDPYTSAADGFAIDFVRLIINPKIAYSGKIKGIVNNCTDNAPLKGATIEATGIGTYKTDENGEFSINNVPSGYYAVKVSESNHQSQFQSIDVISDIDPEPIVFCLKEPVVLNFNGKKINDEDQINLNQIQFTASSSKLTPDSYKDLDALVAFMKENEDVKIELSGYTSSEGQEEVNITLSMERVNTCKAYMVEKGLAPERIQAIGFGPANPIAPNDTEAGRLKNRRVEFGIKRR